MKMPLMPCARGELSLVCMRPDGRYGPQPKVELSFGPNKLPGKLYNVTHLDPGVCETCRKQRSVMSNCENKSGLG
jgi:hypothetical protein